MRTSTNCCNMPENHLVINKRSFRSEIVINRRQVTTLLIPTLLSSSFSIIRDFKLHTLCVCMLCGSEAPTFINDPRNEISAPLPFPSSPLPSLLSFPFFSFLPFLSALLFLPSLLHVPCLCGSIWLSLFVRSFLSCPLLLSLPLSLKLARRSGRAL